MNLQFPKEKYQIHQFSNGLTLIHQNLAHLPLSHCGYFIPIGGRNEPEHLEGIAHFIEHCLFKGTQKRKSKQILSGIDGFGGELNAYTAKEETFVYCAIPSAYIAKAIDILTDVVFFSSFPDAEIEKEKKVILDEIQSYLDSPSELIFDDFESLIFQGHPLGKNILGTETSVQSITQKDVLEFVHHNYNISQMIFSYAGNISFEKIVALLEKNMLKIPSPYAEKKQALAPMYSIENYRAKNASFEKDTHQVHALIGGLAPSYLDPQRREMTLINNILGGAGLNNYLNLHIREKYGFAYTIESHYNLFSDTGYFCVYFGTDPKYLPKMEKLVRKELEKFIHQKMSTTTLNQRKNQLKGHLLLAQENWSNVMINNAKTYSLYGKIEPMEQVFQTIDQITLPNMQEVAQHYLFADGLSTLVYN